MILNYTEMEKQIDDELTLNQPAWGRKAFFANINPKNPLILSIPIQTKYEWR